MALTYEDWMSRTKKGLLTTRSSELKAIDRALQKVHATPNGANLSELRAKIAAWKQTKTDWKTSVRNTDPQGAHPVQELVDAVGSDPPAPATPGSQTLTDRNHVKNFSNAAKHNVHQAWTLWSDRERATVLYEAVANILRLCRIPVPSLTLSTNLGKDAGQFQFSTWELLVSPVYFEADAPPSRRDFLEGAKTIYHEARHCEQWFHMARFAGLGSKVTADTLARDVGIPLEIATLAFGRRMMSGDPMLTLTRGWYASVYDRSGREIDLTSLALQNTGSNALMRNFRARVHKRYASGLPEEKDAWDCEKLLDAEYKWP